MWTGLDAVKTMQLITPAAALTCTTGATTIFSCLCAGAADLFALGLWGIAQPCLQGAAMQGAFTARLPITDSRVNAGAKPTALPAARTWCAVVASACQRAPLRAQSVQIAAEALSAKLMVCAGGLVMFAMNPAHKQ
jgi:hypothetical protein